MTEPSANVKTSWEAGGFALTHYRVVIHDHGERYESEIRAVDVQYAMAQVLIEQHIYLTSATGIEITAVGDE